MFCSAKIIQILDTDLGNSCLTCQTSFPLAGYCINGHTCNLCIVRYLVFDIKNIKSESVEKQFVYSLEM